MDSFVSLAGVCLYSATGVKEQFEGYNLTIMQSIAYHKDKLLTDEVIDDYWRTIKRTSRSERTFLSSRKTYHLLNVTMKYKA